MGWLVWGCAEWMGAIYVPLDFTLEARSLLWYVGPCEGGAARGGELALRSGVGAGAGAGAGVGLGSPGALRGPRGGGAACLGYRRAAAPTTDLAGFEAAEPIAIDGLFVGSVVSAEAFCGGVRGKIAEGALAFELLTA
jgi:hypothetical protein